MSADVTEAETFDLPPERVFAYVTDFSHLAEWDPAFDESRRVDDGPVEEGSTFHVIARTAATEMEITYRVEEHDAPRHARLVGEGDGFTSIDVIDVEPTDDGGSRLTWHATVDADAPVVDTLATPAFKSVAKASVSGLRDELGRG